MKESALKKEISIAKNAIKESLLYANILNKKSVCDIYCLCSHFDYTSFVQIYADNDSYFLLYARTSVSDYLGLESNCDSFESARQAEIHNGKVGKIICGMKKISKDRSIIKNILSVVPTVTEREATSGVILDGRFTYIKNHLKDTELFFCDAAKLKDNIFNKKQIDILNDLYTLITSV